MQTKWFLLFRPEVTSALTRTPKLQQIPKIGTTEGESACSNRTVHWKGSGEISLTASHDFYVFPCIRSLPPLCLVTLLEHKHGWCMVCGCWELSHRIQRHISVPLQDLASYTQPQILHDQLIKTLCVWCPPWWKHQANVWYLCLEWSKAVGSLTKEYWC